MADVKQIANQLVELTVKEVNELLNILKEEHGIEPAAAAVAVAGPAAAGGEGAAAAEKTEFDVILKAPGGAKLQIVKLVKVLARMKLSHSNPS
jgi:large subunit ribosomal protein L7/L12